VPYETQGCGDRSWSIRTLVAGKPDWTSFFNTTVIRSDTDSDKPHVHAPFLRDKTWTKQHSCGGYPRHWFFQTGQGGRTVLPLSSAFPTSRFPGLFFYVVFNIAKHGQNRNPARDTQGVGFFQMGQGGRTVLPPLSSAFPTSRFPGLFFHVVFNMTKHGQNRNPARDTQGVGFFQMGQGGRTVLPPLFQPHVFQVCFSTWCLT